MKVNNNNNYNVTHKAGLTTQMKRQIRSCNVQKVNAEFSRYGIPTNFKDNKIIAWSSFKCLQIIQTLNSKYNLNLALPNGIFVEDFANLDIPDDQNLLGFCTTIPSPFLKNSKKMFPGKSIFFNRDPDKDCSDKSFTWNNISVIADYKKEVGDSSTNHFLEIIFHEFAHAIHFDHLSKILNKNDYLRLLVKLEEMDKNGSFKKKYLKTISKESCIYAGTNPMESVACDLSKRILSSLDEYKLRPLENFTENSPYREHCFEETFLSKIFDKKYDRLIRRFWNGNIK